MRIYRTSRKIGYIAAIIAVALFEVYVVYAALNPIVNNHYRLYYIEKRLATWSHGAGIKYIYGTRLDHRSIQPHLSKKGWADAEETHRWTNGKIAQLYFELDKIVHCRGVLSLKLATFGKQEIKLTINGRNIGNQTADSTGALLKFQFDPKIIEENSITTVQLELPKARIPDSHDIRALSVALILFALE